MENSYEEEIKSKIDALPAKTRDLIYSADMDAILGSIGAKHHLHIDQIGSLGTEAVAVMVGLSESKDFVANVAEALHIDEQLASAVVADVNAMLFVKIQDAMKSGATSISPTPVVKQPLSSVLPSSPTPQTPVVTPAQAPAPTPAAAPTPIVPKPAAVPAIDLTAADMMLSQKTVSAPTTPPSTTSTPVAPAAPPTSTTETATAEPPKPTNYKTDPYREPVE